MPPVGHARATRRHKESHGGVAHDWAGAALNDGHSNDPANYPSLRMIGRINGCEEDDGIPAAILRIGEPPAPTWS